VEWAAGPRKPIRKAHKSLSRDTARSLRARAAAQKEMVCLRQAALCEPEAVLAYLARYTHRVAIANSRLVSLDERGVSFRYKDYRRNGQARFRTMTLKADEFIRLAPSRAGYH
jgi:hypothetical protein